MNTILNISAYKFIPITDAPALREVLLAHAVALHLKGTILLASEGINMFLAGPADDVRAFVAQLHTDARFAETTAGYESSVKEMIQIAWDEVPRIPIFQPSQDVAMQKNVEGYRYWFHLQPDYRDLSKV